jgi:acetyltransferase-like isoleucine patch superfamily enzyme
MTALRAAGEAVGLVLGDGVEIGEDVRFGAHVVVHDGTRIGDGCVIEDGVVLGKRPRLARGATAPLAPLRIGDRVTVCAGAVVYAGADIGDEAIVGDQAQVRERVSIGAESVIGRGTGIENDVAIGAGVRVQSNCFFPANTVIEDDVFVGPAVVAANDNTMGRHGRNETCRGPTLRRACRVGIGAVLLPGVEIGPEAFIAAGAVVCDDVPARAVMMGVPARFVREVPEEDLWERWR